MLFFSAPDLGFVRRTACSRPARGVRLSGGCQARARRVANGGKSAVCDGKSCREGIGLLFEQRKNVWRMRKFR